MKMLFLLAAICSFVRLLIAIFLVVPHVIGLDVLCVGKEVSRRELSDWRCQFINEHLFEMSHFRRELSESDPVSEYLLSSKSVIPSSCLFTSLCVSVFVVIFLLFPRSQTALFASGAWTVMTIASVHAALNHPDCASALNWFHRTPVVFDCLGPLFLLLYGCLYS
eukprot:TRINITY_DN31498_c0_g1_i1.p1 TRINITY_DN31498_c0_g1~~TRINITY_DN31498_c0_g1_i1.p1  ORF type:complete len:165 (+),score=29.80 TRINITY_DN31498_c0_g1_i1:90-584(+)